MPFEKSTTYKTIAEIKEISEQIKKDYDEIPDTHKKPYNAELAKAALTTCFRNVMGLDPTITHDSILNDTAILNIEEQISNLSNQANQEPSTEPSEQDDDQSNENLNIEEKVSQFCSALTLDSSDTEEEIFDSSAIVDDDNNTDIAEHVSIALATASRTPSLSVINHIISARKSLDLDSPQKKFDDKPSIIAIATLLAEIIRSQFNLFNQKNLEDAVKYEKDIKEILTLLAELRINPKNTLFIPINVIYKGAKKAISSFYNPILPGYDSFMNNYDSNNANKNELNEEKQQENPEICSTDLTKVSPRNCGPSCI